MGSIEVFNGSTDVISWTAKVQAKLISKGYKLHLVDANRPAGEAAGMAWDAQADKATGVILTYLDPYVAVSFEDRTTPQTLLAAIAAHYRPDQNQEIERLENELSDLSYDGSNPVAWVAKVRAMIAKLTAKQAPPTERAVRNLVLWAIEEEPQYKIRVELIRHGEPDITLTNLWAAIARLPFPIKRDSAWHFYSRVTVAVLKNERL